MNDEYFFSILWCSPYLSCGIFIGFADLWEYGTMGDQLSVKECFTLRELLLNEFTVSW